MGEAAATTEEAAIESGGGDSPSGSSIYTRDFWLVFAATFALNCAGNLFLMFPLFVVKLGGGASAIGAILATGSLAALLMRPLATTAIDRRGCRWTALWTVVIDIVVMTLYVPLHTLGWPIYAVRALHGAAEGTARVALFALVYEILPRGRQGEAMATFSLCGMVPGAFGALMGEAIMRAFGFHAFFCAAAILCAIAALAVTMLPSDRPRRVPPGVSQTPAEAGPGHWRLIKESPLLMFWIVSLLFALTNAARSSFVAPFAYERGIHSVGWYFTIYAAVAVLVRLSGRMLDRVGLERTLAPSFFILSIGIALIAGAGHLGILETAAVLGGLGHGFAYPVLSALIIRHTAEGGTARSSTIYTSLWDIGNMAGPYLLGLLAHHEGYAPMFLVAGALSMIAAIYVGAGLSGALARESRAASPSPPT
jgi:MFS family permease